jgi:pyruvate-ferredoxin/flavodoxin oxidoreductase
VLDELHKAKPRNHFTVGIHDDVSHSNLDWDPSFSTEPDDVYRALFFGLGSDGTVGANKNTIKILGEGTDFFVQGYFELDSRKAGAVTVSHLRFSPRTIRSTYRIQQAHFVGCHQTVFLDQYEMLDTLLPDGTFLLNTPHGPDVAWSSLPRPVRQALLDKRAHFHVIDAYKVARDCGLGKRINTVMQVCFFALAKMLPFEAAMEAIRNAIRKTYGPRGPEVVAMNLRAVEQALGNLYEVPLPAETGGGHELPPPLHPSAPAFVRDVLGEITRRRGDALPVSAFPADGTFPTGTTRYEKRNLAQEIPVWDTDVCIQCGKCAIVCPHGTLRIKVAEPALLRSAPPTLKSSPGRDREWKGLAYLLQIAPEDCTGCGICVDVCPAKNKSEVRLKAINMQPQEPLREAEAKNWDFFLTLPEVDRATLNVGKVRQQQAQQPLFEFSSACSGCGETPYLKLLTQLFGDRALIANATGCSSIYGGNLPTTPWSTNKDGRGPAWANSLFEDNAEFGLGFRVSLDKQAEFARELLERMAGRVDPDLAEAILDAKQADEADIHAQRERVERLDKQLRAIGSEEARRLLNVTAALVKKSVWIVGGDGWAYDIGFGGLDHVLSSGRDVNLLVLDTEVYSNTGGQASKATPLGAVAKFAAGGKRAPKKDLGAMIMGYGSVYVAQVALGARDEHTLKAFLEAEAFPGPSLIIAYSHCIAHGIEMSTAMQHHALAVESGQWLLYRFDPRRAEQGLAPLQLDMKPPKRRVSDFLERENRFRMLARSDPKTAKALAEAAQTFAEQRWHRYEGLAAHKPKGGNGATTQTADDTAKAAATTTTPGPEDGSHKHDRRG